MIRFFTAPEDISKNSIQLSSEDSEHIRSLRLRPDELFVVCDGNGNDYVCRLGKRNDGTSAEITDRYPSLGEPSIACKLYMAYSKGERLDYAVQKAVELGAYEIILFESERCIAVPRDIPKKIARLQRISLETAKQCGRGIIPKVTSGGSFETAISEAVKISALSLFFYECEDNNFIKTVLEQHFSPLRLHEEYAINTVSIITGPEGGFEPDEARFARSKGACTVSLGSRVLRSETAPVIALAALMYHTGNMEK